MANWQDRFVGLNQLPDVLSEMELETFFRLNQADLSAIGEYRIKNRVPIALQIGFFRFSGAKLDRYQIIPRELLGFLGKQLGVPAPTIASLQALYANKKTRQAHQGWAQAWVGIKAASDKDDNKLFKTIQAASKGVSAIDRLIEIAQQWMFERKLLIPAYSTVRDICVRAHAETEASIYGVICKATTDEQRQDWKNALLSPRKNSRTHLEWLQQAPKRRSHKNLKELTEKIEYLNNMGIDRLDLAAIPSERLAAYARDFQHRKPSRVKVLQKVNLALQMVSFLKFTLAEATDVLIQLVGKKTSDLVANATQRVRDKESVEIVSFRSVLKNIFEMVEDVSVDAEGLREKLRGIAKSIGVTVFPSRAAAVRAELTERNTSVRFLLKEMTKLDIKADEGHRAVENLETLKKLYEREYTELPESTYDCPKVWSTLINEEKDRQKALRALEFAVLSDLRKGFRSGSCWIDHSSQYRDRDTMLIPGGVWEREKVRHYDLLRLPRKVDDYLDPLVAAAEKGVKAVSGALAKGEFKIKAGDISLPDLEAEVEATEVKELRRVLDAEIGTVQLPEMLMQVDVAARFSKPLMGRQATSAEELLLTYAGLLAHGTEMRAKGISLMIPGLDETDIAAAMQAMEYDQAIDRANKVVLQFVNQLPISALWGEGKRASSDMMSVKTSRHLWNARIDPRRQEPSIGIYSAVVDRHPIFYHQPIVLGERQAGVALESVMRQEEFDIESLAVDTHGYTDPAMAFAHMKGFDLCPRLKNLKERRLHVPHGMEVPENIRGVVENSINLDFIRVKWDELVHVVASMSNGTMSAITGLRRFGSAAQGDETYRASRHLGRLLRTIYLSDYFTKPSFRRENHRILNVGENVHNVEHAIYAGAVAHDRGRRREELITISAGLTLLTNIVIAWTAHRMQEVMKKLEAEGRNYPADVWRHVSPASYGRINFKGILNFHLERYAGRLLIGVPIATVVRAKG